MEIKRYDIYVIGLVLLHITILWRVLALITAGSGLQMMSISNGFGYATIAIFVAIFSASFFNLSHVFRITTKRNLDKDPTNVIQLHGTAQRFLAILLIYVFLECIHALHYMGQIGVQ